MLNTIRSMFPDGSIFRRPLVFEIALILVIKILLLTALWQLAFKPLKPATPPDMKYQLGLPNTLPNEAKHD